MSSNKKLLQGASGFINQSGLNIEDVFNIYIYTGDGSGRTITNGIDISGEGGLVWIKSRSDANHHQLYDTVRGAGKPLYSSLQNGEGTNTDFASFTSSGFTLGHTSANGGVNGNATDTYVAWTFRKAPNFFDVVQYTGTGSERTVSHSLGSTPGMIIVKRTDASESWSVYHRSADSTNYVNNLNSDSYESSDNTHWGTATDTTFTVKTSGYVNGNGLTYIAYVFGHDTSDEGLIQCGTYNGDGNDNNAVTLGFEPQWLLIKRIDSGAGTGVNNWIIMDSLRGIGSNRPDDFFWANSNNADTDGGTTAVEIAQLTATGFELMGSYAASNGNGGKFIYCAIRKGPMATPTARSDVFHLQVGSNNLVDDSLTINTGFPVDLAVHYDNYVSGGSTYVMSRLQRDQTLMAELDNGQTFRSTYNSMDSPLGLVNRSGGNGGNFAGNLYYAWRRAPKFFDMVAYDGNGSNRTINHNLGVVPDMIWIKMTTSTGGYTRGWVVTSLHLPNATATNDTTLYLNTNAAEVDEAIMNDTGPTSSVFSVSTDAFVNNNTSSYIAYLFASLAGISKVGTFSHTNGSDTDVDCGFSSGACLVIVKRTDSTGDWYHWDSVRGINGGSGVSSVDPYALLNNNSAQDTSYDYIDPLNSGFQITSNFTTGTYFFYAIAA